MSVESTVMHFRIKYLVAVIGCALLPGCGRPSESVPPRSKIGIAAESRKMLAPEAKEEIGVLVRSGFYDKERLIDIICEEMYEPGELEPNEVSSIIDAETEKLAKEKKGWPAVTDCDRLDAAFNALAKRGVISLHNAGYTQSDGHDDFREAYAQHRNKGSIVGYCFYHGQDVERAVRGGELYLAFGPVDPDREEIEGPKVGKIVCEELERAGLKVDWDGTFAKRMSLPKFVWQKR